VSLESSCAPCFSEGVDDGVNGVTNCQRLVSTGHEIMVESKSSEEAMTRFSVAKL
jgi:hypothetical protein